MKNKIFHPKNIFIRPAVVTGLILLIPILGMFLLSGWDWDLTDFIIMGALIFGTGILVELANSKIKNKNQRIVIIVLIITALLLVWVHLGVGIVDTWPFRGS